MDAREKIADALRRGEISALDLEALDPEFVARLLDGDETLLIEHQSAEEDNPYVNDGGSPIGSVIRPRDRRAI